MRLAECGADPAAFDRPAPPPFEILPPAAAAPAAPLVFASPHSGRHYPTEMMAASRLDARAIRRSEDALVDRLILGARQWGAAILLAPYARAYVDLNRQAWELDPDMFEDALPAAIPRCTARAAAGLGSVARVVAEGQDIYAGKLRFAEARRRIEAIHLPYHVALTRLLDEAREAHGAALLIDWHSMPAASGARPHGRRSCDVVLGDRFGAACAGAVTTYVHDQLASMGYAVERNTPYAGGYVTEFHGRPGQGIHALQIEISRALYLDENGFEPGAGFGALAADIGRLTEGLAQAWPCLI